MPTSRRASFFAGLNCWIALAGLLRDAPPAAAAEPPRVFALVVVDTASQLEGLEQDGRNIAATLRGGLPGPGQLILTTLDGPDATADRVRDYYAHLPAGPDDALVFYYSGHGATDTEGRGHYLDLEEGGPLFRGDLRRAMFQRNPRLVVVLTDCCSNRKPAGSKGVEPEAPQPAATIPEPNPAALVGRCRRLFLEQQGTIDINASTYDPANRTEEVAWGHATGGLFTESLAALLNDPTDSDPAPTWESFHAALRARTMRAYDLFARELRQEHLTARPGESRSSEAEIKQLGSQRAQTPQLFVGRARAVGTGPLGLPAPDDSPRLGLELLGAEGRGMIVVAVAPGSAAEAAGLRVNDIVTAVDGTPVRTADEFNAAIDRVPPGRAVVRLDLIHRRDGEAVAAWDVRLAR